ncbi:MULTISPECIES: hypothetical protein [unclassified Nodularia (in: cyanobacteria)]|uniref:hypothetical protein n=1 Tax=unclassified Nodularia (in: cyanobacteria) TaxID=2656917 RepID=UPI001D10F097|nr:hypothetical protein [Nodularia sp. LEGE 04288]MCC2692371.1 hypothetical protein [Nodularia sp. LEGE 04288]
MPISDNSDRVEFNLGLLKPDLKSKIEDKIHGKRPVILSEEEKTEILIKILSLTSIQVIGNLTRLDNINIIGSCSTGC